MPDTNPSGRVAWCGLPVPSSRITATARKDSPKNPAVIHIVLMPPTVAIINPPTPGPKM